MYYSGRLAEKVSQHEKTWPEHVIWIFSARKLELLNKIRAVTIDPRIFLPCDLSLKFKCSIVHQIFYSKMIDSDGPITYISEGQCYRLIVSKVDSKPRSTWFDSSSFSRELAISTYSS